MRQLQHTESQVLLAVLLRLLLENHRLHQGARTARMQMLRRQACCLLQPSMKQRRTWRVGFRHR